MGSCAVAEVRVETAGFLSLLPLCWAVIQEGPWAADAAPCSQPGGIGHPMSAGPQPVPQGSLTPPSPAPAALCPSCLLNFCLNPSGSLPSGDFQDVASSTLNVLRHFQRQESDPRLLYGPWERGCCVIEAHTCVGLHGGWGRPPYKQAGSASNLCFHLTLRLQGCFSPFR